MRILEIIPTLDRAGAEKQLCLLAAGLPRPEFEVHVCALSRGGPLAAELAAAGIPLVVIGKRWKADPQAFWRLKRHIGRVAAGPGPHLDVCREHLRFCGGPSVRRQERLIVGQRCVDPWKSRLQLAVDRALARRSRARGGQQRRACASFTSGTAPPERVRVIPNGVAIRPAAGDHPGPTAGRAGTCPSRAGSSAWSGASGRRNG